MAKLISIVIPAYNEADVVDELARRLKELFGKHKDYDFEAIIVENGSMDETFEKLHHVHREDNRFKIIRLSRNFGPDAAITAGLKYARGDAAVIMNADLQDPPEKISTFITKWEEGFHIVFGIITKRTEKSLFRRISYGIFYWTINKLTGNICPKNVSDFRLIDRNVYSAINAFPEQNRFLRGMIAWAGFRQTGIPFARQERFAGTSKAYFTTSLRIGLNGIFAFSYLPLRMATILGFAMSLTSFFFIILFVIEFFILGRQVRGLYTTWVLMSFLFGMLFLILGVIGEYLARIYDEVKRRPSYIIQDCVGLAPEDNES